MKRSKINQYIADATEFFEKHSFSLPPFAFWSPAMWRKIGSEADEIRNGMLGWDVTDFNAGDFEAQGLTLFALRNGELPPAASTRCYAEKIMHVREKQLTPIHFHYRKTEDIVNRGNASTGNLAVQLYNSTEEDSLAGTRVDVVCDGVKRQVEPGETILLKPGCSITIPPRLYHSFYAVDAAALIGEISSVNEDVRDNHFYRPIPRFPQIVEDKTPLRLLCTEYPQSKSAIPGKA